MFTVLSVYAIRPCLVLLLSSSLLVHRCRRRPYSQPLCLTLMHRIMYRAHVFFFLFWHVMSGFVVSCDFHDAYHFYMSVFRIFLFFSRMRWIRPRKATIVDYTLIRL